MLEVDHFNADLVFKLPKQFLRVVGTIERLAIRVLSRPGVVTAHDHVGAAMIPADETVPYRFSWTGHSHGEVEQAERRRGRRVLVEHSLIASHTREVIDVAGFRHAHDRMNQEIGGRFPRRPKRQFLMRSVQRIASLERNDAVPAEFPKMRAKLVWRVPAHPEVVVCGQLEAGHRPAQIDRACRVTQIVGRGVREVIGP